VADRIGFLGLGIMGRLMATNLVKGGTSLTVWNRSQPAIDDLVDLGATAALSVAELFDCSDVVIMMLGGEDAINATLDRSADGLAALVAGKVLVNMGTVSPGYSKQLADTVHRVGGDFVEAPVSGSRVPAAQGTLVGMIAGDAAVVERVTPILAPLTASVTRCGPVPSALQMKLAANIFLITQITGLAESFAFAERLGLDLPTLRAVLDGGQMASAISRLKTEKLVAGDLNAQAAIKDVLMNAELIVDAATALGIATPLTDASRGLYLAAVERGDGALDMIGVQRAIVEVER
jgi:3-hydroxyisobutyrate dehydrogenase-like beta-hydroxyacid dehydrogenase